MPSNPLRNWIPEKLTGSGSNRLCQWIYLEEKAFTEPFFEDTLAVCKRSAQYRKRLKSMSDLHFMEDRANATDAVAPAALIFHISRCGSTLLSQLLSIDPTHIVLSEVPFFDQLLRAPHQQQLSVNEVKRYLPAAIRLYAQKRTGIEKHLFIKTDSWHIHFYEQLRELFPSTPFFLLYRDPDEVIRSQQKQRGMHAVPGLIEPGISTSSGTDACKYNLDAYMAAVLGRYLTKMLSIASSDPLAYVFNYADGIMNILADMVRICRLTPDPQIDMQREERCRYHAKHPQQIFSEDPLVKNIPVCPEPVYEAYDQLELLKQKPVAGLISYS